MGGVHIIFVFLHNYRVIHKQLSPSKLILCLEAFSKKIIFWNANTSLVFV
uniref:Uncharacterized protein n=1 Tax=Octopus bimaculoides TaxID=37653 RepID=A0A0L8GJW9_OCTBM